MKQTHNTTQGSRMKTRFTILALFLAALTIACEKEDMPAEQQLEQLRAERAKIDEQIRTLESQLEGSGSKQAIPVTAFTITSAPFKHVIEVKGVVDSRSTIDVSAQMGGRITAIHVRNGQTVKRGDLLLEIDSDLLKKNIAEVETQLEFATTMFEKQKRVFEQKAGSEIQYLQAKTNKESLERRLESLNEQLALMHITAPTSGYIDHLNPSVGEMAVPGMPFLTIVNTSDMHVIADMAESYIGTVDPGDSVALRFKEIDHEVFTRVGTVSRTVNPVNRTFRVEIPLGNTHDRLRPNTTADVKLNDLTIDSTIAVPLASIIREGTSQFVYVIGDDDVVAKRGITTGLISGARVEVTSGVAAGESIVVRGNQDVSSGDAVMVIE